MREFREFRASEASEASEGVGSWWLDTWQRIFNWPLARLNYATLKFLSDMTTFKSGFIIDPSPPPRNLIQK